MKGGLSSALFLLAAQKTDITIFVFPLFCCCNFSGPKILSMRRERSELHLIFVGFFFFFYLKAKNTAVAALICMPIDLTFPLRKSELLKGTEN